MIISVHFYHIFLCVFLCVCVFGRHVRLFNTKLCFFSSFISFLFLQPKRTCYYTHGGCHDDLMFMCFLSPRISVCYLKNLYFLVACFPFSCKNRRGCVHVCNVSSHIEVTYIMEGEFLL